MIGIFGGTFDPIHYGHLRPVQEVQEALGFSQVYFVPAAAPPHRATPYASSEARMEMVQLAISDYPKFVVDDCELRRPGPSYTIDTVDYFRDKFPGHSLCLIIGADSMETLHTWHRWQELLERVHIVVMLRPGWPDNKDMPPWADTHRCDDPRALRQKVAGLLWFQHVVPQDISSTKIRSALSEGLSVSDWVPPAVNDYIQQNGLYSH